MKIIALLILFLTNIDVHAYESCDDLYNLFVRRNLTELIHHNPYPFVNLGQPIILFNNGKILFPDLISKNLKEISSRLFLKITLKEAYPVWDKIKKPTLKSIDFHGTVIIYNLKDNNLYEYIVNNNDRHDTIITCYITKQGRSYLKIDSDQSKTQSYKVSLRSLSDIREVPVTPNQDASQKTKLDISDEGVESKDRNCSNLSLYENKWSFIINSESLIETKLNSIITKDDEEIAVNIDETQPKQRYIGSLYKYTNKDLTSGPEKVLLKCKEFEDEKTKITKYRVYVIKLVEEGVSDILFSFDLNNISILKNTEIEKNYNSKKLFNLPASTRADSELHTSGQNMPKSKEVVPSESNIEDEPKYTFKDCFYLENNMENYYFKILDKEILPHEWIHSNRKNVAIKLESLDSVGTNYRNYSGFIFSYNEDNFKINQEVDNQIFIKCIKIEDHYKIRLYKEPNPEHYIELPFQKIELLDRNFSFSKNEHSTTAISEEHLPGLTYSASTSFNPHK